jgi:hypothetical protein
MAKAGQIAQLYLAIMIRDPENQLVRAQIFSRIASHRAQLLGHVAHICTHVLPAVSG